MDKTPPTPDAPGADARRDSGPPRPHPDRAPEPEPAPSRSPQSETGESEIPQSEMGEPEPPESESPESKIGSPAPETTGVEALRVVGDAMAPAFHDGDLLYLAPPTTDPDAVRALAGALCVVTLTDGRQLLRRLDPSARPARHTLTAFNAAPTPDAEVAAAARVIWIRKGG